MLQACPHMAAQPAPWQRQATGSLPTESHSSHCLQKLVLLRRAIGTSTGAGTQNCLPTAAEVQKRASTWLRCQLRVRGCRGCRLPTPAKPPIDEVARLGCLQLPSCRRLPLRSSAVRSLQVPASLVRWSHSWTTQGCAVGSEAMGGSGLLAAGVPACSSAACSTCSPPRHSLLPVDGPQRACSGPHGTSWVQRPI